MTDEDIPRVAGVTISDRAFHGEYQDRGGPALREWLDEAIASDWNYETRLIPDDQERIEETLRTLVDDDGCHLVFTTGGTGPTARDVTPEGTRAVADKVKKFVDN